MLCKKYSDFFNQKLKTPQQVLYAAATMSLQYKANNSPPASKNCLSRKYIRWKPPEPHFLKLYFDGSISSNHNAGGGFVSRDAQGHPILASAKHIGY